MRRSPPEEFGDPVAFLLLVVSSPLWVWPWHVRAAV